MKRIVLTLAGLLVAGASAAQTYEFRQPIKGLSVQTQSAADPCLVQGMVVQNAVPGSDGIYRVATCSDGSFDAYVDMTTPNGPWVLLARWNNFPSQYLLFSETVVSDYPVKGITNNPENFPVIPTGITNTARKAMMVSENPGWISRYGEWQQFSTFEEDHVFDSSGFSALSSSGDTFTLFHRRAGWLRADTVASQEIFGLWTHWGNSGPCGGNNRVGPQKICPSLLNDPHHSDGSSLKSLYLQASGN